MSRKNISLSTKNMVTTSKGRNQKNKVVSCSTPEHEVHSPSRDSDSFCDSEASSPVPFFCTQDGADGETDVVWNYYTPKSDNSSKSRIKNSTPMSRRAKKIVQLIPPEKPIVSRRTLRSTQKQTELFQDLLELNQNLHKFIEKKPSKSSPQNQSDTDEDIFNSSSNSASPKSGLKINNRCLRKNLLSSKFSKPDLDTALESDDSMNECLLKASQIVEEKILNHEPQDFQDSMDSILNNIKLETPVSKIKINSPGLNNDSFDNMVGNLNDSALERLTQMPVKNTPVRSTKPQQTNATSDWVLQDLKVYESSPSSRNIFGRHNSMPESPTVDAAKPSTSGMIFGRHSSMPFRKDDQDNTTGPSDSPIKCTPDEIRKKHYQAREKLLAKRLLPFTSTQQSIQCTQTQSSGISAPKKPCFEHIMPTISQNLRPNNTQNSKPNDSLPLKQLIEKKRQEALMKLRRKQKS